MPALHQRLTLLRDMTVGVIIGLLILAGAAVPTALTETKNFNGGQWTAYTGQATENIGGVIIYKAPSFASANPSIDWITVNTRGYNNSTGWHLVAQRTCSRTYPNAGTCRPADTYYDASNNNPPSTGRYATSTHEFYQGGTEIPDIRDYTSHNGSYSTYNC
jgi:hypothetical protein